MANPWEFDEEKLKAESEAASEEKSRLALMNLVANNLSNRQSIGNFALGKMNPTQDLTPQTKILMDGVDDPYERTKGVMERWKATKELKDSASAEDPTSEKNTKWRDSARQFLPEKLKGMITDTMTESQFKNSFSGLAEKMLSHENSLTEKRLDAQLKAQARAGAVPKGMVAVKDPETGEIRYEPKAGTYKQNQYKAGGFAVKAEDSEKTIEELESPDRKDKDGNKIDAYDYGGFGAGIQESQGEVPLLGWKVGVPDRMKSEDFKRYNTAVDNFVSAVLRPESGASIAPHEREAERRKYFPVAGDTPQVKAEKAQKRAAAMAALRAEAGGAYNEVLAQMGREQEQESGGDPAIQSYADQYGLTYGRAEQILKKRGYGQKPIRTP